MIGTLGCLQLAEFFFFITYLGFVWRLIKIPANRAQHGDPCQRLLSNDKSQMTRSGCCLPKSCVSKSVKMCGFRFLKRFLRPPKSDLVFRMRANKCICLSLKLEAGLQ